MLLLSLFLWSGVCRGHRKQDSANQLESCFFDLVNPSSETENDAGRYPGVVLMRAEEVSPHVVGLETQRNGTNDAVVEASAERRSERRAGRSVLDAHMPNSELELPEWLKPAHGY